MASTNRARRIVGVGNIIRTTNLLQNRRAQVKSLPNEAETEPTLTGADVLGI